LYHNLNSEIVLFSGCLFLTNNEAYKVTAAMDLSKIFQFLSPAIPATKHDIERMREVKRDFEAGIDERDVILADHGYQWFQHEVLKGKWSIKKKSPKNKQLSKEGQGLHSIN